jgi:hypothetical protein
MSQRRKTLRMSNIFLPCLVGEGPRHYEVVKDALPPDTTIVNVRMSDDFRSLVLLIESESFDEIPEGLQYPEIDPQFRRLDSPELATAEPQVN